MSVQLQKKEGAMAEVVEVTGKILFEIRDEIKKTQEEIKKTRTELKGEIAELKEEIAEVKTDVKAMWGFFQKDLMDLADRLADIQDLKHRVEILERKVA